MVSELTIPGGIAATTVADAAAGDAEALAPIVGGFEPVVPTVRVFP